MSQTNPVDILDSVRWAHLSARERQAIRQMVGRGCYRLTPQGRAVQRICPSCRRWLPYTARWWHRRANRVMGLNGECKRCNVRRTSEIGKRRRAAQQKGRWRHDQDHV